MSEKLIRRTRKAIAMLLRPIRGLLGARGQRWVARQLNPRGQLYIPPELGVAGFFAALRDLGVRHVVLRWFERLPHVERGHDLDMLVSDADWPRLRALLSDWPLGQKVDVYSETGLDGTGYRPERLSAVPAFPRDVAAALLRSAQTRAGGWAVPAPQEHFLGLAYHAIYLKGYESGLPPDAATPVRKTGSRDYAAVLTELAQEIGLTLEQPVTMAALDRMLQGHGWTPSRPHLDALAPANAWIATR
ncbi:hypothetical protein PGB28_14230 [Primorskyibacter aestuariivivens]|uniref:hypothetical protein n=1 Tax=Primorskyibacter aestuariivivens TaxID=1888912 RepID=UPI0022FFEE7D|nr:hypothetical protein [Primorskyibacter aestuariivivens]MDA7429624.1 hypothetical protein [Primorskyibacter aestuariivivens]